MTLFSRFGARAPVGILSTLPAVPGALAAICASAILSGLFARGGLGWLLGFVMLVPWLRALDARRSLATTLLCAWAMSLAFTAAVFAWFGIAIGHYTQVGALTGLAVLLLAAPLFQPQFITFALVRHLAGRRHGPVPGAFAGASAWVATEWLVPRLLGDTLGYGLYPSQLMRQGAAVGGAAGLSFLLLIANEGLAAALANYARSTGGLSAGFRANFRSHLRSHLRSIIKPLALAALVPLLLAGYGWVALSSFSASPASPVSPVTSAASANNPAPPGSKPLRMGLIQSNIVDYERRRQQSSAYEVVRKVLDTHFAMSYDAVERQHVDAVLWSETTYPTTFTHPKSAAGAELDNGILGIVNAAGVPFVFGTYDRDAAGEYNAAAFVMPGTGLLGFYRKTRLFPLTEYVPAWLDGPQLRRWLPWAGSWQPGNGARVLPLRLADGREIPVLPLICLDDVDAGLGIDGARLGAQVILTMSNDAWFTDYPQGAALHQAVAAFRSIETRLPQFRVTTNGYSAVIDATGSVLAGTRMGEQTLVTGEVPIRNPLAPAPPRTLMVLWGNWVGLAGLAFLLLLAGMWAMAAVAASPLWRRYSAPAGADRDDALAFPCKVAVLPPAARLVAGLLRTFARGSLLWMVALILQNDALRSNTLAQIRLFASVFLAPEAAAWCVLLAFAAQASLENGALVLTRGTRRFELALRSIVALAAWRIPIPGPGLGLWLDSPEQGAGSGCYGLLLLPGHRASQANPAMLIRALVQAQVVAGAGATTGPAPAQPGASTFGAIHESYGRARLAVRRGYLDHALAKFVLLPFLLALPAFYLHQHIAYGSGFGEYTTFGLKAYLIGFALWWAAWAIGTVLCGAVLRAVIEAGTVLALLLRREQVAEIRRWLERLGNLALYFGLPLWLLLRIYGN